MGRACVCCGDECLNDVIYLNVDRYAPAIRSFVETTTEVYEVKVSTSSFFNAPTSIELISSDTKRTIDSGPFVSNTFRTEKVSSKVISEGGKLLTLETWEKTTVVRKLALSFSVDDVFDWEKENKYGIKFIDSIYLRLGDAVKKNMSGLDDWAANSSSGETTTSVFSGIFYGQDLPPDVSGFDSLFSDGEYQFDIIGMSKHAAVDIDSFFERGSTKYLILLQSQDTEIKDGFLDQEPDENGGYKREIDTRADKKPGSLVGLGRWRRGSLDSVEQKIWLELIRPGTRNAATSQSSMDSEVQYWLNDTGNILYDWHDCFERIAEAEYVSTCKYMDVSFGFSVFDDIYFKEGSKLEIELFRSKTDNTKQGARKTEAQLLYELVLAGNVIREIPNTYAQIKRFKFEDEIEYRFLTRKNCDGNIEESLPLSEWPSYIAANPSQDTVDNDCSVELFGEVPELTPCSNINRYNFYKIKEKELFEWDLKYSIGGVKDLIMTKYTNPCDSLEDEFQVSCQSVFGQRNRNSCYFIERNPVTDNVGLIFIRDCVIETTPGYHKDGDYTHRYNGRHPIHGSYEPLNIRIQLIDQQYYPSAYSGFTGFRFTGISIQEVKNTRTGNNPDCPVTECLGGPSVLEWELTDEDFTDLSNDVTFEPHHTTIYDGDCHTRIISSKKRKENVGGNIDRVITASTNTTKYIPSSEEFYIIAGMGAQYSYCQHGDVLPPTDLKSSLFGVAWWESGPLTAAGNGGYGGETSSVCQLSLGGFGIGFGGGVSGGSTPCRGYDGGVSAFCSDSGDSLSFVYEAGEYFQLFRAGGIRHLVVDGKGTPQLTEEIYYTSNEPDVTRRFIDDQLMYEDYTSEEYKNITDWDNDIEMATVHDITVTEEPYFLADDFDAFYSTYDRDVRDIVLGKSREGGNIVPGDDYIVGEGIRFRIQESFLNCQRERDEEGDIFAATAIRSTFSDFDILYQFYAPVIVQDAQLDEDQVGEIAGYLTDFDYWYQIKGTFFIEDENGEDLSEDDEGNIIVGTYVTNKWFYIDGAGNINGPFDSSGFVETLPDFAVYDKVDIYWDGEETVFDSCNAGLAPDEDYVLRGEDHRCTIDVLTSNSAHGSQFEYSVTTDCWLPKIDVSARDLITASSLCGGKPCQTFSTVDRGKIADAWFTSAPETVEGTRTISKNYVGTSSATFGDSVTWQFAVAGDYCSICSGYCLVGSVCQNRIPVWQQFAESGYEPLDLGEELSLNFEIPVRGINVPTEEFDYKYNKGDEFANRDGITQTTTGFLVPQANGTHFYKKTVPRFSCGNLPEITFTGDDLLFKCSNFGFGEGEIFNIWGDVIADLPYGKLPRINVLKNARWDLTKKYGILKCFGRRGRIYDWDSVISEIEAILSSVEWNALTNVSNSYYDRAFCRSDTPTQVTIFETHDGCFGLVRQTENPNDYGSTSFQIEKYGIDTTYWNAYNAYIELLEKYKIEDMEQDFVKLLASYQSGYDFCYWNKAWTSDYPHFGYSPRYWDEQCPHLRPSKNLPGPEYDKWGPDSIYNFAEGCGEDRGGIFKYDPCRMPNAAGPWRSVFFNSLDFSRKIYCDSNDCMTEYSQLNKYEEVENKNYTFTIKGKNSVEEQL